MEGTTFRCPFHVLKKVRDTYRDSLDKEIVECICTDLTVFEWSHGYPFPTSRLRTSETLLWFPFCNLTFGYITITWASSLVKTPSVGKTSTRVYDDLES